MRDYRLYKIDNAGRIVSAPAILHCEDDDTALVTAQQYLDECAIEIWDAGRRVAFIPSDRSE